MAQKSIEIIDVESFEGREASFDAGSKFLSMISSTPAIAPFFSMVRFYPAEIRVNRKTGENYKLRSRAVFFPNKTIRALKDDADFVCIFFNVNNTKGTIFPSFDQPKKDGDELVLDEKGKIIYEPRVLVPWLDEEKRTAVEDAIKHVCNAWCKKVNPKEEGSSFKSI
jgi:hypothetical protein